MQPIRARRAGTCVRTGAQYDAGALIVKTVKGWALAQDRAGNVKIAPDYRTLRTSEDKILPNQNVNARIYCSACMEADGVVAQAKAGEIDCTDYAFQRNETGFEHVRCGRFMRILTNSEVYDLETLPYLHVTNELSLSHRIEEKWPLVSELFRFESWSDLSEMAEDNDDFDNADEYQRRGRGGRWVLRNQTDVARVEEILGILPENRWESRRAREAEVQRLAAERDRQAAQDRRENEALLRTLFSEATDGEYPTVASGFDGIVRGETVPWRAGFNAYGGGQQLVIDKDGLHIWWLVNNGADGDDWSSNNVRTGGAGAIGRRFPRTAERIEFLCRLRPELRPTLQLTEAERKLAIMRQLRDEDYLLRQADKALRDLLAADPIDAGDSEPCVWVRISGVWLGLTPDRTRVYLRVNDNTTASDRATLYDVQIRPSDNASCYYLHYAPTAELLALIDANIPDWVRNPVPGRYTVGSGGMTSFLADNAADALDAAWSWRHASNEISLVEGVAIVHYEPKTKIGVWSDGKVTTRGLWHVHLEQAVMAAGWAERRVQGQKWYLEHEPSPRQPRDDWGYVGVYTPPPPTDGISKDASGLLRIALGQGWWRESARYERLFEVASIERRESLATRESLHSTITLEKLHCTLAGGAALVLYLVHGEGGCMGEDGDTWDDDLLFENEADAQHEYDALYSEGR